MSKLSAWEQFHFNALFHGSDWKDSTMYNDIIDQFASLDVDVIFLPHTEGISSTLLSDILHKLKEDEI